MPGGVTVRVATDADTGALIDLYAVVLGELTPERVRWLRDAPSGRVRRLLALSEGRVVGHMADVMLPTFFDGVLGATITATHWMVHPDHQGRGVGRAITDVWQASYEADASVSFVVDSLIPMLDAAYPEDRPLGHIPAWSSWRQADAVSARTAAAIPRPLLNGAIATATAVGRIGRTLGISVTSGLADDAALDAFAQRSATFARCIRLRDAAHIRWRWSGTDPQWSFASAHDRHGRLRGWIVYGVPEHDAVGQIIDVLVDSPHALRSLVGYAADDLAGRGVKLVFLRLLDARRWVTPALVAAGFVRRGSGPYVIARQIAPGKADGCTDRARWYLTAGDADRL